MNRYTVAMLLAMLSACGGRGSHKPPPPVPADYSAPTWSVDLVVRDGIDAPTAAEFEATLTRTTQLWLDYWRDRSGGMYRPPQIPRGAIVAQVIVERNCSNSGESGGNGAWGMIIKGQRCDGTRIDHDTMLSWACHWWSHTCVGTSGGNASHSEMARVAGC